MHSTDSNDRFAALPGLVELQMTPLFISCCPLGLHDTHVDGLQEGGHEKVWAASRLNPRTEEMCPLAFHLAAHSALYPVLPLVSVDGGATPTSANPAGLCACPGQYLYPTGLFPASHTTTLRKRTVSFPGEALWRTLPSFFVDPSSILFAKRWMRRVLPLPIEEQAREMGASFFQCRPLPHIARPVSSQVPRTAWSLCACGTRGCVCGPFSLNTSTSFYSSRCLILYHFWTMCRKELKINLGIQFQQTKFW